MLQCLNYISKKMRQNQFEELPYPRETHTKPISPIDCLDGKPKTSKKIWNVSNNINEVQTRPNIESQEDESSPTLNYTIRVQSFLQDKCCLDSQALLRNKHWIWTTWSNKPIISLIIPCCISNYTSKKHVTTRGMKREYQITISSNNQYQQL